MRVRDKVTMVALRIGREEDSSWKEASSIKGTSNMSQYIRYCVNKETKRILKKCKKQSCKR